MESVSRNKRYLIKRIIDNDNTLTPSDLEKLHIRRERNARDLETLAYECPMNDL